jgi:hypothetical protein
MLGCNQVLWIELVRLGGMTDKRWFLEEFIIIIRLIFVNYLILLILIKRFGMLLQHFKRFSLQ